MIEFTREQINSVELSEEERKSNEAFLFLTKVASIYNEGWTPSYTDRGYTVYSNLLLNGTASKNAYPYGLNLVNLTRTMSISYANQGARLSFKSQEICEFVMSEFKQEFLNLFMVNK